MSTTKRNFYKKGNQGKTVLKKTIRPTYKHSDDSVDQEDLAEFSFTSESSYDVDTQQNSTKSDDEVNKPNQVNITPDSETDLHSFQKITHEEPAISPENLAQKNQPIEEPQDLPKTDDFTQPEAVESQDDAQSEIGEIQQLILKATDRLKFLEEEKKRQEDLEAERAKAEVVDEFNGVDDEQEELQLIKERLDHAQKVNKKLSHELSLVKSDFEKEKKHLEKTIRDLKKELHRSAPVEEHKVFSFSQELREAVKSIETLNDPQFKAIDPQVVVKADTPEPSVPETQLTKTPKTISLIDSTPIEQVEEGVQEKTPAPSPVQANATKKAEDLKKESPENKAKKKKKSKEKKLLVTGVSMLVLLLGGGLVTYRLTAAPKVNEALVEEYLNDDAKVLGAQTRKAVVADGIIADKNSDANYDETEWTQYKDPNLGVVLDYPANVTERLHTSASITFMRKDSYIFKITKRETNMSLDDYWAENKDKGIAYEASPIVHNNIDALHLELVEQVEYPGDRYLLQGRDAIYDVWFATDPEVFGQDDILRAKKMLESLKLNG